MDFGFEKLKETDVQKDVSEKNQQELGNFKVSETGELLYRKPGEEPEINGVEDYIDFLDREVKHTTSSEEKKIPTKMLGYIETPKDFEEEFESKIKGKSETEVLTMINNGKRDLSFAHESMERVYNLVLGQRLDYKDISDEVKNNEVKQQLDERIHLAQTYQKNILELEDFLEQKNVDYILRAEKNGTLLRDIDDNDED
ncbi:MAG: hypothetical protein M1320_00020 [Patescibacteria group bacterium]|nr:hypothetical protein [Patescibacteria group bacterium]